MTKHPTDGLFALARARFVERSLYAAKATDTTQYVTLGEGLGEFSFREEELLEGMNTFQQDTAARFWKQKLITAGFRPFRKTLFTWLGRSEGVSEEEFAAFLADLAPLCTEGSQLVMDCPDDGIFHIKSLQKTLKNAGFLLYEYMTEEDIRAMLLREGRSIAHTCLLCATWKR